MCACTARTRTQELLPAAHVAASVGAAIARAAQQGAGTLPLQLQLSVAPSGQVAALLQELDPLGACVHACSSSRTDSR